MFPGKLVSEFHTAFGVEENVPFATDEDGVDYSTLDARCSLNQEEIMELDVAIENASWALDDENTPEDIKKKLLASVLKEACDVVYVVVGMCKKYGWDFDEAFRRVHESNMSKLGEDGRPIKRNGDGKVLKGPNYAPPDLTDLV